MSGHIPARWLFIYLFNVYLLKYPTHTFDQRLHLRQMCIQKTHQTKQANTHKNNNSSLNNKKTKQKNPHQKQQQTNKNNDNNNKIKPNKQAYLMRRILYRLRSQCEILILVVLVVVVVVNKQKANKNKNKDFFFFFFFFFFLNPTMIEVNENTKQIADSAFNLTTRSASLPRRRRNVKTFPLPCASGRRRKRSAIFGIAFRNKGRC